MGTTFPIQNAEFQSDRDIVKHILDTSILTMEIADPTVVWFSERLDWVVDRLMEQNITVRRYAKWIPLGQRTYGGGRQYTHYCSLCSQHGYSDMHFCSGCGADMSFEREAPEKELYMEL